MKQLCFGDIVVVEGDQIGVIVKCWNWTTQGLPQSYDVYVRSYDAIKNYLADDVDRYMVRHISLDEGELKYQIDATRGA